MFFLSYYIIEECVSFSGMTPEQLNHYIQERQSKPRTFVGINLHGIKVSAWVEVSINLPAMPGENSGFFFQS